MLPSGLRKAEAVTLGFGRMSGSCGGGEDGEARVELVLLLVVEE
jgi:hypothetical protein